MRVYVYIFFVVKLTNNVDKPHHSMITLVGRGIVQYNSCHVVPCGILLISVNFYPVSISQDFPCQMVLWGHFEHSTTPSTLQHTMG